MPIHRSRVTFIVFMLCFGFASICNAITFGNIKVYSYLDEPLVAELELTDLNGISPDNLLVGLADSKDFVRAGLERPYFLTNLLFNIINYQEKTLIFIRSAKPVKTPYLEFLLNLSWLDGSLIKEYTILIDPPPFNLNSATRPKALSKLALQESDSKSFSDDNISQQLAAQELASRPNVVLQRPRDVSKDLFSDDTIDAPDPATAVKTPAVTPVSPAATTPPTADTNVAAIAPTPTPPPSAPADAEYKKQMQAFKQQEEQKAKAQEGDDLLDRVIDKVKSSALIKGLHTADNTTAAVTTTPVTTTNAPTNTTTTATAPTVSTPAVPAPKDNTPAAVTITQLPTTTALEVEIHPEQKSSIRGTFTILVGVFLLIVAAGVAFVIKRKIRFNPKAMQAAMESIVEPHKKPEVGDDENLDFDLDLSDKDNDLQDYTEEAPASNDQQHKDDMDSFEEQLSNTDLDKLLETEKPAAVALTPKADPKPEDDIEENIDIIAVPAPMPNATELNTEMQPAENSVEAINLKIELAKSYLEAGDKDSAKELLNEVIAEAKDEQKLAAELLLSGIL